MPPTPNQPPGQSACPDRETTCEPGSPSAGPPWRTCGRAGRSPGRRSWRLARWERRIGCRLWWAWYTRDGWKLFLKNGPRPLLAISTQLLAQIRPRVAEDGDGQQGGVNGAGPANGQRPHGDTGGHLHDGEQRIHALEGLTLDGDAEDWDKRLCRRHPRQVGRPAGPGNDDFKTAPLSLAGVFAQPVRGAMRRDDAALMRNGKLLEHVGRMTQRFPVGLAPHDDPHQGPIQVCHE